MTARARRIGRGVMVDPLRVSGTGPLVADCPDCGAPLVPNDRWTGEPNRLRCSVPSCRYRGPVPVAIEMKAQGAPMLPGVGGETDMARRKKTDEATAATAVLETAPPGENGHEPVDAGIVALHELVEQAGGGQSLLATLADEHNHLFGDIYFDQVSSIDVDDIYPSDDQGRQDWGDLEELGRNIQEHGLQEPVIVRHNPKAISASRITRFQLVAGERRWRAHQAVGLGTIPAIVRRLDDRQASEVHLLENTQRKDLNSMEEAHEYRRYLDSTGATQAELGKIVGKSQSAIANTLRLLDCPEAVQAQVISGDMTAYAARLLLGLRDDAAKAGSQWLDGVGNFDAAEVWKRAGTWTSTQMERAIRHLNKRTEEVLEAEQKRREAERQAEEAAEKLKAEGAQVIRVTGYGYPEGVTGLPQAWIDRRWRSHEQCASCPTAVTVIQPGGQSFKGCVDKACYKRLAAEIAGQQKAPTVGDVVNLIAKAVAAEAAIVSGYAVVQDPETLLLMLFGKGGPEDVQAAVQRAVGRANLPKMALKINLQVYPSECLRIVKAPAKSTLEDIYLPSKKLT